MTLPRTLLLGLWMLFVSWPLLAWSAEPALRGTGDLGVIVERGAGRILIVSAGSDSIIGRVEGLGDLSHARWCFRATSATPTCSGATAA